MSMLQFLITNAVHWALQNKEVIHLQRLHARQNAGTNSLAVMTEIIVIFLNKCVFAVFLLIPFHLVAFLFAIKQSFNYQP